MNKVKIKLNGGLMPVRQTDFSAGYDLYVPEDTELHVGRQIVDMKFSIEMPGNIEGQIRPRSGFSAKGMEVVMVSYSGTESIERIDADVLLGTIDADYRNSVGVTIKVNEIDGAFSRVYLRKGTRIAQIVFNEIPPIEFEKSENLSETERKGGYGSTGVSD